MVKSRIFVAIAIAVGVVAMGPSLTASAAERPAAVRLNLVQATPIYKVIPAPEGFGTVAVFESSLTRGGKPFGTFSGTTVRTDVTPGDVAGERRIRTFVFDLPKGQIVAIGTGLYAEPQTQVPALLKPTLSAVVGGTGDYLGARGQLKSIKRADGSFVQQLTILQ